MIRAVLVDKNSPFLGDECALCKHPMAPGDEIVICPEDGSRHHVHCWQANGDSCTNYGCAGSGPVVTTSVEQLAGEAHDPGTEIVTETGSNGQHSRSKVRILPSSSLGCAQSCLLLSIAIAILLFAVGCFGLWSIADYILLEVLDWQYRASFTGSIPIFELILPAIRAAIVSF